MDKNKLKAYWEWAQARLAHDEDPRDVRAFVQHLKALGADDRVPHDYGLPFVDDLDTDAAGGALDQTKLIAYSEWARARLAYDQDPRDVPAFVQHLKALGVDYRVPHDYGLPYAVPAVSNGGPTDARSAPRVLDWEGVDLWSLVAATSNQYGIPAVALLAMLRAESGLDPHAQRWGRWPDISFGLCQITVQTAEHFGIGNGTNTLQNILAVRAALFDRATAIDVGARFLASCMKTAGRAPPALIARCLENAIGSARSRPVDVLIMGGLVVYNYGSLPGPSDSYWMTWQANVKNYWDALMWAHEVME
jgi:hypothetical protein